MVRTFCLGRFSNRGSEGSEFLGSGSSNHHDLGLCEHALCRVGSEMFAQSTESSSEASSPLRNWSAAKAAPQLCGNSFVTGQFSGSEAILKMLRTDWWSLEHPWTQMVKKHCQYFACWIVSNYHHESEFAFWVSHILVLSQITVLFRPRVDIFTSFICTKAESISDASEGEVMW